MISYVLILLAVVGIAIQFSLTKLYQKRTTPPGLPARDALRHSMRFSLLGSVIAGCFFLALNGFRLNVSLFSLAMAALLSLIGIASGFLGILVLSKGPISIYTLFMMLGGMLLPFLVGVFLWDEPISPFRIVGLIVLVAALFLPILEPKKESAKSSRVFFLLCGVIFLLNGATSVFSKTHQTTAGAVDVNSFLVMTNCCNIIVTSVALFFLRKRSGDRSGDTETAVAVSPKGRWLNVGIIVAYAVVSGCAYMFQLIGAVDLDASLLYPMVTGGTIVFSTLAGLLFFRERPGKWTIVSTVVTLGATLLFLF